MAFIDLNRGLRQGCTLSMPLYVLVAERIAINMQANPNIHGLRPPGSGAEVKLPQFAYDTTLLLTDDGIVDGYFIVVGPLMKYFELLIFMNVLQERESI